MANKVYKYSGSGLERWWSQQTKIVLSKISLTVSCGALDSNNLKQNHVVQYNMCKCIKASSDCRIQSHIIMVQETMALVGVVKNLPGTVLVTAGGDNIFRKEVSALMGSKYC